MIPEEIKELKNDVESVLDIIPGQMDWGSILGQSELYEAALTETLLSIDSSDFIASDTSGGLWLFAGGCRGWKVSPAGSKPAIYRWNEEMIGDLDGFDVHAFEAELKHLLPGVEVVKVDAQGVWTKNEFEERFAEKLSEVFDKALGACCE